MQEKVHPNVGVPGFPGLVLMLEAVAPMTYWRAIDATKGKCNFNFTGITALQPGPSPIRNPRGQL